MDTEIERVRREAAEASSQVAHLSAAMRDQWLLWQREVQELREELARLKAGAGAEAQAEEAVSYDF